jgi:hypothetical protein
MKFTMIAAARSNPESESLAAWLRDSEFAHPRHLREELERMGTERKWIVSQHNGITNVHGPLGIVARIKPL